MLNQRMANGFPVNLVQLLRLKVLLLLLYSLVFCFIGWLTHISNWTILLCVMAIQSFASLFIFFRSVITANQFFTADAWFSVIDKSLMIVLCGGIIYTAFFGKISLVSFLQIQIACTAIAAAISFLFILKRKLITTGEQEDLMQIVKRMLPFAMITLLMSVHYRLDGFLLERIHTNGALEAGIYASAYRLLDAGSMFGYLASSFLVAFVARHLKEKTTIGATSFVFVFASWLQELLYHSAAAYNSIVMQLCIASFPAYCLVHVYGSVLTGAGRLKQFITILLLTIGVNIAVNIALIPSQGAMGCCIAAIFSQYFCGLATMFISTKQLSISYNGKSILVYLMSAILLITFFYFGKYAVINTWIMLVVAVGFCSFLLITQLSFFKKPFILLR
jgi:O-antigen/teichoic acid export membrane protein